MDLEAKREALAKAMPLLKGGRRSGKWHRDRNLIAWLRLTVSLNGHSKLLQSPSNGRARLFVEAQPGSRCMVSWSELVSTALRDFEA